MTDADLARIDALLAAAREVAGCSDHGCVLRVYPRGGMGTNGGCHCVCRHSEYGWSRVRADRLDLVRLLTLARQAPALVAEVERLRSCGSVSETLAEDGNAMLGRALALAETFQRERDEARSEVERLRAIVEGRTVAPTDAETEAHAVGRGRWRCLVPEALVMCEDALHAHAARLHRDAVAAAGFSSVWWPLDRDGRPCAWPVVPSP